MVNRQFINVEEALNFIEKHLALGDLDLYNVNEKGLTVKKKGMRRLFADLMHAARMGNTKRIQLEIIDEAIKYLRQDFEPLHNDELNETIEQLRGVVNQTKRLPWWQTTWTLDPVVSALRRFRVALSNDADYRLERQKLMIDTAMEKIERLKQVDRKWIPGHILDFLCEIEDQIAMYEIEKERLETGHRVYTSIIEKSHAIDSEMDLVHKKHLERLPNALNWGVLLSLEEMTENGIPRLDEINSGNSFLINDIYVENAKKKYEQLRRFYLKYHGQLRKDLKGSFDNNFAEFEGRLYFAEQVLNQKNK